MLTAGVIGVGILYNEEELKKNKLPMPKSWADLKKPEYAGRLGITAPQSSMGTAALVMLARINGGGEKNIEPGFQATKEIVPKNTIFTWSSEMSNLFQLGRSMACGELARTSLRRCARRGCRSASRFRLKVRPPPTLACRL